MLRPDLYNAHKGEDGLVHLLWKHNTCFVVGEVIVSTQDYGHVKALLRAASDPGVEVPLSEAQEEMVRAIEELRGVNTLADIGWGEVAR